MKVCVMEEEINWRECRVKVTERPREISMIRPLNLQKLPVLEKLLR